MIWDQWGSSHSGPVMNYLAKCSPDCKSFKGDTGNVWVKIDEVAYDPSKKVPWGSDCLARNGASWTLTIPPTIADGEYLLRHEILGLHVAGRRMGAQFCKLVPFNGEILTRIGLLMTCFLIRSKLHTYSNLRWRQRKPDRHCPSRRV